MTFIQENAYLILLHGCSLVGEDFNNFRLCGSAASHANTKLSATKEALLGVNSDKRHGLEPAT